MEWRAVLPRKTVTSDDMPLLELLRLHGDKVEIFHWMDGMDIPLVGVNVPTGARLVAFRRNYQNTDGTSNVVLVVGWERKGDTTIAFRQPDGLVELSKDKEYVTTDEQKLGVRE